jgi:predicted phage tail protein
VAGEARALYRGMQLAWTNPDVHGLVATEIWGSLTNDRATATLLATPASRPGRVQTWVYHHLIPGHTWYFWIRSINGRGQTSTWFPVDALDGWTDTVRDIVDLFDGADVQQVMAIASLRI